ncbi:hypothetical protein JCM5296_001855 [Sporobolomyces johnsonii]
MDPYSDPTATFLAPRLRALGLPCPCGGLSPRVASILATASLVVINSLWSIGTWWGYLELVRLKGFVSSAATSFDELSSMATFVQFAAWYSCTSTLLCFVAFVFGGVFPNREVAKQCSRWIWVGWGVTWCLGIFGVVAYVSDDAWLEAGCDQGQPCESYRKRLQVWLIVALFVTLALVFWLALVLSSFVHTLHPHLFYFGDDDSELDEYDRALLLEEELKQSYHPYAGEALAHMALMKTTAADAGRGRSDSRKRGGYGDDDDELDMLALGKEGQRRRRGSSSALTGRRYDDDDAAAASSGESMSSDEEADHKGLMGRSPVQSGSSRRGRSRWTRKRGGGLEDIMSEDVSSEDGRGRPPPQYQSRERVYFPSPLPTTRLSISTSALPTGPSPTLKSTIYKTPGRASKGKFKDKLGGVQEEEGEEILSIVRGPEADDDDGSGFRTTLWAALGREEVSVWSTRPKVVLAKLRRTPVSLRTHGSNASVHFHSSTRLIITTTSGHHLLYSISLASSGSRKGNAIYVLPGGEKAAAMWPKGPGEGHELEGIVLMGEAERGMAVGDGVGCVCVTPADLLVSVLDPPCLRVIPFPSTAPAASSGRLSRYPSSSMLSTASASLSSRRGSGWESLASGLKGDGESEAIVLDEWDWLVGKDRGNVTISSLVALPTLPAATAPSTHPYSRTPTSPYPPSSSRKPSDFIMITSDGRAYLVHWGPPSLSSSTSDTLSPKKHKAFSPLSSPRASSSTLLFDDTDEAREEQRWRWQGVCFHPQPQMAQAKAGEKVVAGAEFVELQEKELDLGKGGSTAAVTERMGLVAVGCENGTIAVYNLPTSTVTPPSTASSTSSLTFEAPALSHTLSLRRSLNTTATALTTGRVTCLSWTSDGYALAVGWAQGWSVWSVYGRLGSWSVAGSLASGYGVEGEKSDAFEDHFMHGVRDLFWSPGNLELFVLCPPPIHPKKKPHDEQLFVIPFAKSAVTASHTPDNTKNAFLQMDDRVLVYRGADQPDMSVINPDSDVWQHIKIPASYIATQYPIRYAVISSDARLIAVAGQRGLTHYNALSGRWKLFETEKEEEAIRVVGGMAWWSNVLIVACVEGGQYQLRLFSRDKPLSLADSLEVFPLDSEPLLLSVFDSSLLVYTADNTFHHFLIRHAKGATPRLRMCGSIGFEGVVLDPRKVRGLSWLVPKSQQRFGDPADDLNVATIIFLISGRLVLLRPRRAAHEEVKYDLQILATRIEFYWTHLSGIGTLENSLWGWDGKKIRIWLDALTIEKVRVDARRDAYETVKESVGIELDFYPLAVLMDKGIVVGVDQETSLRRSLDFAIFRIITTTHLFLHHILRFHLTRDQRKEAVLFASHYQHLVYFAHALEILLHAVLEDEADAAASSPKLANGEKKDDEEEGVLPRVVEFLDHFDESLQVVVNCARKTEVARWEFLFNVVGKPRELFEKCMAAGFLKVAASYLLVLHNLEPLEQSSKDTVRLLKAAMEAGEWTLCRELLRFLYSLDRTCLILRTALSESSALPPGYLPPAELAASHDDFRRAVSSPNSIIPPSFSAPDHAVGQRASSMAAPPPGRLGGQGLESLMGRAV